MPNADQTPVLSEVAFERRDRKAPGFLLSLLTATLLSFLALPEAAATELAGATLEVERAPGAEGCPDAELLSERTLAFGTSPAQPTARMRVRVEFSRLGQRYQAVIRTSGRSHGSRQVFDDGPGCGPLATATSLVLAVLLDLRPHGEPTVVRGNRSPAPSPRTAPLPVFRYAAIGARASAAYGLLGPTVSLSFGGDVRARLAYIELELGGFAALRRTVDFPPGSVSVNLAAGSAGLCVYPGRDGTALELGACGALLLGRIQASGRGFFEDREAAAWWTAGRIGATLAVPLARHWAVRLSADLLVPFRRYTLDVERVGLVYESSPVAIGVTFGPELRFL
jgi:hypothetical protein